MILEEPRSCTKRKLLAFAENAHYWQLWPTARDGMQMNYKVIFVSDANAALTDAAHNATVENMALLFADVMTTTDVTRAIRNTRSL